MNRAGNQVAARLNDADRVARHRTIVSVHLNCLEIGIQHSVYEFALVIGDRLAKSSESEAIENNASLTLNQR